MSLHSTEMGDHLEIISFSSILLILLNSLISLTELHKTPNIWSISAFCDDIITLSASETSLPKQMPLVGHRDFD